MYNFLRTTIAVLTVSSILFSCNNDDSTITNTEGSGNLTVEFDNAYGGNDLILESQPYSNSNGESLKINTIKYIVSNIVLTNESGQTFTYPKSESYFIVDEAKPESLFLNLKNIPAGNYTKIKIGIGVDQAQWELGSTGQGDLFLQAQAADLMWSWSAGYKFLAFEGTFTSPANSNAEMFMVHTGKTGTDYNYTEITLDLPAGQKALVRSEITPEIHIVADLSKITDGANKINFSQGAMIMGGAQLPIIVANLSNMFSVAHVHND